MAKYRIVRRYPKEPFEEVLAQWEGDIEAFARTQRVIGWDRDDIRVELQVALWRAWSTYKPWRGDFGVYFWSIWLNHKGMQIRKAMRLKRAAQETPLTYEDLESLAPLVLPFEILIADNKVGLKMARSVWTLLAMGYTAVEVQRGLQISRKHYEQIVEQWKTEAAHKWLSASADRPAVYRREGNGVRTARVLGGSIIHVVK